MEKVITIIRIQILYAKINYQSAYNQAASESQAKKSRGSGLLNTILSVGASILMGLL